MAATANEQGGTFYKAGQYAKAQESYELAMRLDPAEPKYPSNLSAVLYEAGRYPKAITAIRTAWKLIHFNGTAADALAIKLATRFAKARSHGFCSRAAALHAPEHAEGDAAIEAFVERELAEDDAKVREMRAAWAQWRAVRDDETHQDKKEHKKEIAEAQARLRAIPIFKSTSEPTREYYTFGHDDVLSLMDGINNSREYRLDAPEYKDQRAWSFLFGGSGDARQVFGTLVHLATMANPGGTPAQSDKLKAHFTLIDVHPASLARVLVVLSLLGQILETRRNGDTTRGVELFATLFYVYTAMVMPSYCHQILMDTASALVAELPARRHPTAAWLHVSASSLPRVLDVLRYWAAPLRGKTTRALIQINGGSAASAFDGFASSIASLAGVAPGLHGLMQQQKLNGGAAVSRRAGGDVYGDPDAEGEIYKRTKALLPPKALLTRHPALAALAKSYSDPSENLYAAMVKEVEETWVPNSTLFDKHSTAHPYLCMGSGYPVTSSDSNASHFKSFVAKFARGPAPAFCRGSTCMAMVGHFFTLVADALGVLQDNLTIEIVVGDAIAGTARLLAGDLGTRPKGSPARYSRIWLSNVPDYTNGPINNAVHLAPHLEPDGLVIWNCLLNTANWKTVTDYTYNYALLLPDDFPRILGCTVLNPLGSLWKDVAIQALPLPRPLSTLASKAELHAYLAHLLVSYAVCAIPSPPPTKVEAPNNLGALLRVLTHLPRVGFPAHWAADFAQAVLADTLVAAAAPHAGTLPIPLSAHTAQRTRTPRRLHLAAWQAGLHAMFAEARAALPFALAVPADFPSAADIRTYTARVVAPDLRSDRRVYTWGALVTPFSPSVGALFVHPAELKARTADALVALLPDLLEGTKAASVQVLLGLENVDLPRGLVEWKMARAWYDKMEREGWVLLVFRTDLRAVVTEPVTTKFWAEFTEMDMPPLD